jgi:hypothetical protein
LIIEAKANERQNQGGYLHGVPYIQAYAHKPDWDIRTVVAGDEVIYAVYRRGDAG